MTDSLSWVSQFQSLPIKPRTVYAVVADFARLLAKLTCRNQIHIHYVPSHVHHTSGTSDNDISRAIGRSNEIDQLAKNAANIGTKIEHGPFLKANVKRSHFQNYPDRDRFLKLPRESTPHMLINRARTGHSRCRQHLSNIEMDDTNKCRHCDKHPETIEHQVRQRLSPQQSGATRRQ
uniref:Uncharacterized protein n=1 Tax=Spongospora subterranea TaxID=70186 RepID=A0A0H5R1E6_9EUKA|eukprot:CRZ07762.1 hypothetical protein [Spongospora subterranea]